MGDRELAVVFKNILKNRTFNAQLPTFNFMKIREICGSNRQWGVGSWL